MKATIRLKEDEQGLPEEIGIAMSIGIIKPLRYVALFAVVFISTAISELGR